MMITVTIENNMIVIIMKMDKNLRLMCVCVKLRDVSYISCKLICIIKNYNFF